MTRHILLAASLFLAPFAQASEVSLHDVLSTPDQDCFLKADMSFASALRMISTFTMPERQTEETVFISPKVRVRTVRPAPYEPEVADAADVRDHTYRPAPWTEPETHARTVRPQ